MAREMKDILTRSADHLIADTVGIIALVALLVGSLHLPALF